MNKSATFARPVVYTFQQLNSSCDKCQLNFYIDVTGYQLHIGDFLALPLTWRYFFFTKSNVSI